MSLYRCAVCGSPNVVKIEKNDGFSYSKALAGTAVFGTVGAVAGINGKKTYAYSQIAEQRCPSRWIASQKKKLIWL